MLAVYLTAYFRLGRTRDEGYGGLIRTYRLGWLHIAVYSRKAAHMALVAPKEGRLLIGDKVQPCGVCRSYSRGGE